MARTLKSKATVGPKAVKRRRKWKASRTPVDSTNLIELTPDHPAWRAKVELLQAPETAHVAGGAIVKLTPPPGTSEELVRAYERLYYAGGASTVKVMPAQEEVKITVEGETFDFSEADDGRSLRQVALDRVERTTNSNNLDALRTLVNEAMDHGENP